MIKFMRNKLVRIHQIDKDHLEIHGMLADDIYELELDVVFKKSTLEIVSIEGRWNRWTTPECPRAIPFLQEAVGLRMGKGFSEKVKKMVGRKSCRHYANLLLECCHAAREAVLHVIGEKVETAQHGSSPAEEKPEKPSKAVEVPKEEIRTTPTKAKQRFSGCIIDLHVHTTPASPCSSAPIDGLIAEAKRIGLHAFCLTDHDYTWSKADVEALMEQYNYLLLRGNEVTTDQGHMLVFGLEKKIDRLIRLEELREEVNRVKGFIIVAHPFRGFLTFGVGQLGLTPDKAKERALFKRVDAIEVLNGKVTKKENAFAREVAQSLGMPTTGGSDAHEVDEIGQFATRFESLIRDEKDLLEALHDGAFSPVAYKEERGIK